MIRIVSGVAAAAISALLLAEPAAAQARVRAGTLSCGISGGVGLIVASQKSIRCVYRSIRGGREGYVGSITKVGLDVGATSGGRLVWAVYAPSRRGYGALAGDYVGGSAEATVGLGLGANVLVGGSNRTVALQPLSVQGQEGLNVALGVSELRLRPAR
jgi:hypothetical protein